MMLQIDLLSLPFEKFKFLVENYYLWIKDIDKTTVLYIELHKLDIEKSKEIIKILKNKSLIDEQKIQTLLEYHSSLCKGLEEYLKEIHDEDEEKEWIVYYNHRDIGQRVKAKTYTEAFLAAYENYGADGNITKVEKA